MFAVEAGQMFASETVQMPAVETFITKDNQRLSQPQRRSQLKTNKISTTKDRSLKTLHNYPKTLKTLKTHTAQYAHHTIFHTPAEEISSVCLYYCNYYIASSR